MNKPAPGRCKETPRSFAHNLRRGTKEPDVSPAFPPSVDFVPRSFAACLLLAQGNAVTQDNELLGPFMPHGL